MASVEKKKQWSVRSTSVDEEKVRDFAGRLNISPICARLILARGYDTSEEARRFICRIDDGDRNPLLMADMEKAVERIHTALADGDEVIAIYGDYDVDGVTAVSLLYLYLTSRGARTGYYIPSRSEEGYGMSRAAIDRLHERGVTLIVTVDTGITAVDEVAYAESLGIDVVVTDHHECHGQLPGAVAVVNPHRPDCPYPFTELAGVGVVFKLVCACEMIRARGEGRDEYLAAREVFRKYADLVAVGTVADVMPVTDENRAIIAYGLALIENTPRCGIAALIDAATPQKPYGAARKRSINSNFIGFGLAPRINAAGRMGNASVAVELLLSENDEQAKAIAERLCEINRERQAEENRIAEEAQRKIEECADSDYNTDTVIVLDDDNWQQGIIGIVASRITEKYGKPSILVSYEGMLTPMHQSPCDIGKGSGRSIHGLNLVAAMTSCEDLLVRFGGHELAAGMSITRGNLPLFRKKINEYAAGALAGEDLTVTLEADFEVAASDITLGLARELAQVMEPCGVGNPTPAFIIRDAELTSVKGVGGDRHCKLGFISDGKPFGAMYFGKTPGMFYFYPGERVDIMFTVGVNSFNGSESAQLILTDIAYSREYLNTRVSERARLRGILDGGSFTPDENVLPEYRDFVNLYRIIKDIVSNGCDSLADQLMMYTIRTRLPQRENIGYIKYKLLIKLFAELSAFGIREENYITDDMASGWDLPQELTLVKPLRHTAKIDIESSPLLRRLRGQCVSDGEPEQ